MVLLAAAWIFMAICCFAFGFQTLLLIQQLTGDKASKLPSTDLIILTGFAALTTLLSYWSWFSSISYATQMVFYTASFGILLTHKSKIVKLLREQYQTWREQSNLISWVLLLVFVPIALVYASSHPSFYDSGLYHAQAIKWIQEYPVVNGLGNFHGRFAFNNHLFLASAFFILEPLKAIGAFPINGFLFLLVIIRSAWSIGHGFKWHKTDKLLFGGLTLVAFFTFLAPHIASPSSDITLSIIIAFIIFYYLDEPALKSLNISVILCLALFAFTLKLSALFLLLFPIGLLVWKYGVPSMLRTLLPIGLFFSIGFLIRNFYLSGYLVYPIVGIDLFNVDWKIPIATAQNELDWIKSWARIPFKEPAEVLSLSLAQWAPLWWENLSFLFKLVLTLNFISLPLILLAIFKKRDLQLLFLLSTFLINLSIWFFGAPDFRFAFGLLIGLPSLGIALFVQLIKLSRWVVFPLVLGLVGLFMWSMPNHIYQSKYIADRIVNPSGMEITEVDTINTLKIELYKPVNGDRCFNSNLPCSPYISQELALRGGSIEAGFRIEPDSLFNIHARKLLSTAAQDSSQTPTQVYYYSQENCLLIEADDRMKLTDRFFLHITPEDSADYADEQAITKQFNNYDFNVNLDDLERPYLGKYYVVKKLPDYPTKQIFIGQFNNSGRVWQYAFVIKK